MVDCQFSAFIKNPVKNVYQTATFSTNWPDVFEYCAPLDCRCCKNKRKVSVIFLAKIRYQTILYSAEATILDKINGKFIPPLPPKSRMGKWGVMAFARLHPWFGGGGVGKGLLLHLILSKTVVSKKIESSMYMYVQAPYPDTVSHLLILNISAFWSQKNKNLTTIMNILLLAISLFSWNPQGSQ